VRGTGLVYHGFYYVKNVTHSVKRGEYNESTLVREHPISLVHRVSA